MWAAHRGRVVASALALAVIAGVGLYGTLSVFTDTTGNSGNTFAAGTVVITDDDAGSAAFAIDGMRPGDSATRCVNVVNAGSMTFSNVAFSGTPGGNGLAGELTVDVDRGTGATGGPTASCAGFTAVTDDIVGGRLSDFPTIGAPVDDPVGWTPAARKSYRVVVALPADTPNSAQGRTATLDIRWDASS